MAVLEISARPLANVSVKRVEQVQIIDHLPVWRVQFSFLESYLISINIDNTPCYFPFWQDYL